MPKKNKQYEPLLAGLLDLPDYLREGIIRWHPDCLEPAGIIDLTALARALAERVRVLGEARHSVADSEVSYLARDLAEAAVTAARTIRAVADRMMEE